MSALAPPIPATTSDSAAREASAPSAAPATASTSTSGGAMQRTAPAPLDAILARSVRSRAAGGVCACGGVCDAQAPPGGATEAPARTCPACERAATAAQVAPERLIQRAIGDGHDLTSPRFSRIEELEAVHDGERTLKLDDSGRGVQAVQQALYDLGFDLPANGADGNFTAETGYAVRAFQRSNPPLAATGVVDRKTLAALNARFPTLKLPSSKERWAPWTPACVCAILCPWSPRTIEVLSQRITLKTYDSITFADEEWTGSAWIPKPMSASGYNNDGEIGVQPTYCERMAEILYHEVLHAEQPKSHKTSLEKESYAYRIGEEFSIAAGLGGKPGLRSTDVRGRKFADTGKIEPFVAKDYPVPKSGAKEDIIGKADTHGHVRVRRDGEISARPAAVGEKVPGRPTGPNERAIPNAVWKCP